MNRWLKLAVLAVAAVIGAQLLLRPAVTSTKAGVSAPPLALRDLSGRRVELDALRGRVVLVNFWATWCPPCRAELPELAQLWLEHKDRCFELLGVAEDSPPADLSAASRAIPYPVLTDPRGEAAGAWGVAGFPSSFLVDARGDVVRVFEGAIGRREVQEVIRPLLPQKCEGT